MSNRGRDARRSQSGGSRPSTVELEQRRYEDEVDLALEDAVKYEESPPKHRFDRR